MVIKKVTWLELFYDLLFVAAVSKASHVLLHVEDELLSLETLGKFVLIFIPIWWAWVGQTLFVNRYGQDTAVHRIFLIIQLFFVLIMTASLSVDFDANYLPFLIGYLGLRVMTAVQYHYAHSRESGHLQNTARYLGTRFWIGLAVSACSLFFDSWLRYAVLYAGIALDIILPLTGRRIVVKTPANTHHLLERFSLFALILLGESVVSILAVLQSGTWTGQSLGFAALTFVLIIAIWWQYYDNLEKKVDMHVQTAGQTIIYGHLFIYLSLSMLAASIQLLFLEQLHYDQMLNLIFGSALLYFASTTLVFHVYRHKQHRLGVKHLAGLAAILICFYALNLGIHVPGVVIMAELALFFAVYAKITA